MIALLARFVLSSTSADAASVGPATPAVTSTPTPAGVTPVPDNTVSPASLFFTVLALALLTASQPTGYAPYFPLHSAPILRSLRISPLFCAVDSLYTLLFLPLLVLWKQHTLTGAARILVYYKLTADRSAFLIERTTDANAQETALDAVSRDTRFRVLIALPSLLGCAKLFGMHGNGISWFQALGLVYIISWLLYELLFLIATRRFTRYRDPHTDLWWDELRASARRDEDDFPLLRSAFVNVSRLAFILPQLCFGGYVFVTHTVRGHLMLDTEGPYDPWRPMVFGKEIPRILGVLGSDIAMKIQIASGIGLVASVAIFMLAPVREYGSIRDNGTRWWENLCLYAFFTGSLCALALEPLLCFVLIVVGEGLVLVVGMLLYLFAYIILYVALVVVLGVVSYGGWRRCPRDVRGEYWWWGLLFVDERVFVVQQIVWAALLCYWVYNREGTEKEEWTELLG
jgi:hypothetical protein